jgi:hypothetical protein
MLRRLHEPAGRTDRRRRVDAAIDEGRDHLGVDLRLGVAAHGADHDPRAAVPQEHPRHERVECPLARGQDVRLRRVQAEVAAPVLVVDPGLRVGHAGAEPAVVRLDEADGVAVAVHDAEPDRPASRRVGRRRRVRGAPPVDAASELGEVGRIEQALQRDVAGVGVGEVRIAVGHRELGRLDA